MHLWMFDAVMAPMANSLRSLLVAERQLIVAMTVSFGMENFEQYQFDKK